MKALNKTNAQKFNREISGWLLDKKAQSISKRFEFKDFSKAMNFVKKVAQVAEAENHHPDIHVLYNKVLLKFSTHSVGGLSLKDFTVATRIDSL